MDNHIGQRFAEALARKDAPGLLGLLDPEVDFRGLTPSRFWDASSATALVDGIILGAWFEADDRIDALEHVELGSVADRDRVAYLLPRHDARRDVPGRAAGVLRRRQRPHQLAEDPVLGVPRDRRRAGEGVTTVPLGPELAAPAPPRHTHR
jgi:hypothetical protein